MIPALLAIPVVQDVVGQVMNTFAPAPTAPPAPAPAFTPALNNATSAATTLPNTTLPNTTSPSGILRADQWNQLSPSGVTSWAKGLAGRHVDATDATGRTISGVVTGVQPSGNTLDLNIGGHIVSLSSLKQISWSPSV